MKELAKAALRLIATALVSPWLVSFAVKRLIVGRDRAITGSSQSLSLVPGLTGQYLRRAFLARTLAHCGPHAVIEFGVLFSQADARIDDYAYIGPRCHIGLVHIEADVMLAAGVHVPSGARTHGTSGGVPMRQQEGTRVLVSIGRGTWVGSNAVVMADIGANSIVGAGAVVTRPLPDNVVAAGVPARIVRERTGQER